MTKSLHAWNATGIIGPRERKVAQSQVISKSKGFSWRWRWLSWGALLLWRGSGMRWMTREQCSRRQILLGSGLVRSYHSSSWTFWSRKLPWSPMRHFLPCQGPPPHQGHCKNMTLRISFCWQHCSWMLDNTVTYFPEYRLYFWGSIFPVGILNSYWDLPLEWTTHQATSPDTQLHYNCPGMRAPWVWNDLLLIN